MLGESKTLAWGFVMGPHRLRALVNLCNYLRIKLVPRYDSFRLNAAHLCGTILRNQVGNETCFSMHELEVSAIVKFRGLEQVYLTLFS